MRRLPPFAIYALTALASAVWLAGSVAIEPPEGDRVGQAEGRDSTDEEIETTVDSPLSYAAPKTIELLIGLRITPGDGDMIETSAQTVFPTNWPEQSVEIVETIFPNEIQATFRDLPGNNKQLLMFAPLIRSGPPIEAVVRVRITKTHIVAPEDTSGFVIPKRTDSKLKQFLASSPYIDVGLSEIKRVVKQIDASEPLTDWRKVEMLYDWVRDNIEYTNGDIKPIKQALKERKGDCEEMTGIFIALCRAAKIPARCVWIPNHCYPEFYLEDESGKGHWFPCQVAGTRNFGNMPEYLPILQKGDRFKVPEKKETLRYLADYLSSQKVTGRKKPKVDFIRKLIGDAASLPAPDAGANSDVNLPAADSGEPDPEE